MTRILVLFYGAFAYVVFLASFLYAVAWLGGFGVPKTIDSGLTAGLGESIAIHILLLTAFAVQHSVMARPAFKRLFARIASPAIERSTYVLAASVLLLAVCLACRPMPTTLWRVQGEGAILGWVLFGAGWLIVLGSTFVIDHFDLFGLRQAWLHARGRVHSPPRFVERLLYRFVRHPIMLGFLIAFWATPAMSLGHLLFATVCTIYILVALQLEERDLVREHGDAYLFCRALVPMLMPGTASQRREEAAHGEMR